MRVRRAVRCAPIVALAAATAAAQPDDGASVPIDATAPVELHAPVPGLPFPSGVPAVPASEQADDLADDDIETFAKIYVALEREAQRYERAIAEAESEQEAQEIQARLQSDSLAILERHGWSQQKFDRVAKTLNARPELAAEALRRIDEER
ncbi:MAG TPA: DUF4168 domain-containing protein [Gammaproteobacteria bacterium]